MPIGKIQPPTVAITDEPLVCFQLNADWVSQLLGMIYPAQYPEWWAGTLEQNRYARQQVRQMLYLLSVGEDCDMAKDCCVEPAIILQVNPTSGIIQQSSDNGVTWTPAAGGLQSVIVAPVPPVTSGVAGTVCDASLNVAHQVDLWIEQVIEDFDTATTLTEFATAVFEAILAAVLVIFLLPEVTPLEASVIAAIGASLAAAWTAGKTVFENYFTDAIKKAIKCAVVHNIGTDGSFNDTQFSGFWNEVNSVLPASPAKMLLMGFLSSSGKQGLNAMAASGYSTDGSCDEDDCGLWCFDGDFTTESYDWLFSSFEPSSNPSVYNTSWTDGVGWQTANGDPNYSYIQFPLALVAGITLACFTSTGSDAFQMSARHTPTEDGTPIGSLDCASDDDWAGYQYVGYGKRSRGIITAFHMEGVGVNPFGSDNC